LADRGHELTDEYLKRLEQRMADEYSRAYEEMARKVLKYWEQFSEGEEKQRKLLEAGKITQAEYNAWRFRHIMVGQRWEAMLDVLTVDAHNTNVLARQMVAKAMPDVFMLNANYTTYQLEHDGRIDTGFTLYDHDAAMFLMEDRDLMPPPSEQLASRIAANKDLQWNKRHIQSAVLQGILQGENPYDIAKRLIGVAGMAGVGAMNYRAAVRYARTMVTSAQNAGRYEAFNRAERLGVELTIEWVATLDGRTRHEHRLMHGMRTKVNEPFVVNGIRILYPAQQGPGSSDIPQRLIWNCRCTLNGWVKGFEGDTVKSSPKMGGMSFEEWQHAKEPKQKDSTEEKPQEETFSQKIAKIKQRISDNGGAITEADLHEAGKLLAGEYSAEKARRDVLYKEMVEPLKAEFDRANKAEDAAYDLAWQLRMKFRRGEISREEWDAAEADLKQRSEERKALRKQIREAEKKCGFTGQPSADWLRDMIGQTRDVGSEGLDIKRHLNNSKSQVVPSLEFAYSHYPKEWVEYSLNRGYLIPRKVSRGYYSDWNKEICISGSGDGAIETAFHELGHRFEKAVPGILDAEKVFYERRTDGCPIERLCDLFPGYGYKQSETVRKDNFVHPYSGKNPEQYNNQFFELVSMGFEDAYMKPQTLAKDEDMQSWIYGLLLLR